MGPKVNQQRPIFKPLVLGPLPSAQLAKARILISDGEVHFSIPAQRHAYNRHPETYMSCAPFLSQTVLDPSHVGQAPDHAGTGFEIVREIKEEGIIVLLAVVLRPTNAGIYHVSSTYPIDRNKLERRVRKGYLIAV